MANTEYVEMVPGSQPRMRRLLAVGGLAMALSIIVNFAIYTIANTVASDLIVAPNTGDEMLVAPVIIATIVTVAMATAFFTLFVRRFQRSVRAYAAIAAVVLVLSFGPSLLTANLPIATRLALVLMHVATAAITVGLLTTRGVDAPRR